MPENAVLVERDAAVGGEISRDARARRHLIVEC